jgi:hypothetical protein
VPWIDDRVVKLCPTCAKNFHVARRKHHCRLCGAVMCHECTQFLPLTLASMFFSCLCYLKPYFNILNMECGHSDSLVQLRPTPPDPEVHCLKDSGHCEVV